MLKSNNRENEVMSSFWIRFLFYESAIQFLGPYVMKQRIRILSQNYFFAHVWLFFRLFWALSRIEKKKTNCDLMACDGIKISIKDFFTVSSLHTFKKKCIVSKRLRRYAKQHYSGQQSNVDCTLDKRLCQTLTRIVFHCDADMHTPPSHFPSSYAHDKYIETIKVHFLFECKNHIHVFWKHCLWLKMIFRKIDIPLKI